MISALKKGTTTTQTFWGCDDTNTGGVLGVFVDGSLSTGDTLSATDDYTGLVTVTGLSSGSHSYQMALDGVAAGDTYTFKTHPSAGEDYDCLLVGDGNEVDQVVDLVTDRESQARCVFGAEMSYIEPTFIAGEPTPGTKAVLPTVSNPTEYNEYLSWYRTGYRTIWARSGWHRFINTFAGRYIWHNHEFDSDETDNGTGVLSADGECQWDAALKAFQEYEGNGNPTASDSGYTVDTIPDPVIYFSEVIGDVEFICVDYTSYCDAPLDYNMNNAGRGEERQKAWIESVVAASTAKSIIMFVPSNVAKGSASATQEWVDAGTGLLKNGLQVDKPIMFITANTHVNMASGIYRASGMARAIPQINISCFRQTSRADVAYHPEDNPGDWEGQAYIGTENQTYPADYDDVYTGIDPEWVYGLVQRRGSYTKVQIKNVINGNVRFEVTLNDNLTTTFSNRKQAIAGL